MQESLTAVIEVRQPMLYTCGAERMHVEAYVLALLAVTISLQCAYLVKSHAQVGAAERFVLVKFQPILVIQMQRPKLPERHGKIDFVRRVKAGQDRVCRFDEATDAFGIPREL